VRDLTRLETVSLGVTAEDTSIEVSRIAKGNWQLADRHGAPFDQAQAIAEMRMFVEAGVTLFDCADHYVGVEALIGAFRQQHPDLARRLRVSTKVVPDLESLPTLSRADIVRIVDTSLQRLHVERLDLAQFHWWDYRVPRYVEVMMWLAELQQAGKIALLATTNMDTQRLREITAAGVRISANQLQYSALDRRPEHGLAPFCQTHKIALLCYGVLAGGFISERWLGASEPTPPLANRSLVKYRLIIEDFGGWARFQELLATLAGVARARSSTIAAVATRYILDKPGVAVAIIGARTSDRLGDMIAGVATPLDAQHRTAIDAVVARALGPQGDCYDLERDVSGSHSAIMWKNQNAHGAPQDAAAYTPPTYRPS
jgi:aryl-alcohol dehydrogenase-like predicted oxidoreductase